jgi:hypothetical protein
MSIGTGVVLFVIGAILRFAVNVDVPGVSLSLIGLILMIAGGVVFVIGLALLFRRREAVTSSTVSPDGRQQVTRTAVDRDPEL